MRCSNSSDDPVMKQIIRTVTERSHLAQKHHYRAVVCTGLVLFDLLSLHSLSLCLPHHCYVKSAATAKWCKTDQFFANTIV